MGRLIDEVKALEAISEISHRSQSGDALTALMQASNAIIDLPTVDAVEVVRYKDCKRFKRNPESYTFCNCIGGMADPEEHDFCSYGERRNDDSQRV